MCTNLTKDDKINYFKKSFDAIKKELWRSCLLSDILRCPENPEQDIEAIEHIIQLFKEHPSIKEIKKYKSTKEPIKLFHLEKLLKKT